MSPFGKRIDGVGGRRRTERSSTPLSALLVTISRSVSSLLADVSRTGAKLRSAAAPACGQQVVVRAAGLEALATVVWNRGEFVGVSFEEPLDEPQLHHLRRESRRTSATGMTPDELDAAQDWLNGSPR